MEDGIIPTLLRNNQYINSLYIIKEEIPFTKTTSKIYGFTKQNNCSVVITKETNITTLCTKLIRENQPLTQKMTAAFQTIVFATTGTLTSIINQNNYEVLSSFAKSIVSIGGENYNVYALENVNVADFGYTFKF